MVAAPPPRGRGSGGAERAPGGPPGLAAWHLPPSTRDAAAGGVARDGTELDAEAALADAEALLGAGGVRELPEARSASVPSGLSPIGSPSTAGGSRANSEAAVAVAGAAPAPAPAARLSSADGEDTAIAVGQAEQLAAAASRSPSPATAHAEVEGGQAANLTVNAGPLMRAGNGSWASPEDVEEAEAKAEVDAALAKAAAEEAAEKGGQQAEEKAALGHPGDDETEPEAGDMKNQEDDLESRVAKETKSKALAEMLGGIRVELYKVRHSLDALKKDVQDGIRVEPVDPAEHSVYPLSTCMQCILGLTALYFLVYMAMAICKVLTEIFVLGENTTVELSLQGACDTVFYAPMLCVLFLGAQLRATQISQGERGPPATMELAMQACSWSVLVQTVLVLAIPAFTGQAAEVCEDLVHAPHVESRATAGLLTLIRYSAMLGLYMGFSVVSAMVILMDAQTLGVSPVDLWDDPTTAQTEYAPEVSAAMCCTISLTLLFFAVYLCRAVLRSLLELSGAGTLPDSVHDHPSSARRWVESWEAAVRACTHATNLAPMVCILFMAAGIQALEQDPKNGRPQWWAEGCFYACAWAIYAQVLIVLAARLFGVDPNVGSTAVKALARGISKVEVDAAEDLRQLVLAEVTAAEKGVIYLRVAAMFLAFVSVSGVVLSVFVATSVKEDQPAPTVAPAMWCAITLACLYFAVYLVLFLTHATAMITFQVARLSDERVERVFCVVRVIRMAEYTVKLCPMTAILWVAARMRALHLSDYRGSVQCWAQDAMYVATFALVLQLLVVLGASALSPRVEVDEVGSPISRNMKYLPGKAFLEAMKAASFVALYGGVLLVGVSVLTIRPETAGCPRHGFFPLVA